MRKRQKSGDNSELYQSERDIHIHNGAGEEDIRRIVAEGLDGMRDEVVELATAELTSFTKATIRSFRMELAQILAQLDERLDALEGHDRPTVVERTEGSSHQVRIAPGTSLFRVHSDRFVPTAAAGASASSRFSPAGDVTSTLYLARSALEAMAETLLQEFVPRASGGPWPVHPQLFEGRVLSVLEPYEDLVLYDLGSSGVFEQLGVNVMDAVHGSDYELSQDVARRVRLNHPEVAGIAWPSRRSPSGDRELVVLFSDRVDLNSLKVVDSFDFASPAGQAAINSVLTELNFVLAPTPSASELNIIR